MRWLDVAGPPGCGKSTICYELWGDKSVTSDGKELPSEWMLFIDEIRWLCAFLSEYPAPFIRDLGKPLDLLTPAVRMNDRSLHKMAAVSRMEDGELPFIQTGFVQRGLGFGWRMVALGEPVEKIRRFFELMPVSLGVVFLEASPETVIARNHARRMVPETAHEDRAYQVPLMLPAIQFAKYVLKDRGVPVWEIDVENQSPEQSRERLKEIALHGLAANKHSA